jgi:hypothetical protein
MFNSTDLMMVIDRELYELHTANKANAAMSLIVFNKTSPDTF